MNLSITKIQIGKIEGWTIIELATVDAIFERGLLVSICWVAAIGGLPHGHAWLKTAPGLDTNFRPQNMSIIHRHFKA